MEHKYSKKFSSFQEKSMADLTGVAPNIMDQENFGVSVGFSSENGFGVGPEAQRSAVYASVCDSAVTTEYVNDGSKPLIRDEIEDSVQMALMSKIQDSMDATGLDQEKVMKQIRDSGEVSSVLIFDRNTNQYVKKLHIRGVNDSILNEATATKLVADSIQSGLTIPVWNQGMLNKIITQPLVPSYASMLVKKEGSPNPWADVINYFSISFDGYARIDTTAKSTVEANYSSPVGTTTGQYTTPVVNLAVDYTSSIQEDLARTQEGNILTGRAIGERERYAGFALQRLQDQLIYFGNAEAGLNGLIDINGETAYAGTSFTDILAGGGTTKGAQIAQAMINIISEFAEQTNWLASKIILSVSPYVMKALKTALYSEEFNSATPWEIIMKNWKDRLALDAGISQSDFSIVVDPMLNPNTPFNPSNEDLMFITAPSVFDANGVEQKNLVFICEPIDKYIVPAMWQRSGMLYTQIKRTTGVQAPIKETVKVYRGVGI